MKFKYLLIILAAGASAPALSAQVNSAEPAGYAARAAAMLGSGNYVGCIDQCSVGLELGAGPQTPQLLYLRAVAAFRGGMPEARACLNQFLGAAPQNPNAENARFMLASLTFFDGDYSAAIAQLKAINRNALELSAAETLDYRIAYSSLKLGDFKAAESLFSRLASTKAYANSARFYQGYIAYLQEDFPKALNLLQSVNKSTDPGNKADFYIAQILFKQGNYAEALALATPLMSAQTPLPEFRQEAMRICGESLYALGREADGIALLRQYDAAQTHLPLSTAYILGKDAYVSGSYSRALDLLAPVSELQDAMGQSASLTMGQSYMALDNPAAAMLCFEKAARQDFDADITELAYYNYAVAQVDGGRIPFGSTVKTLEEFIQRYPRSSYASTVQDYLVKGYMATDDYEGALRSLNALTDKNGRLDSARQQVLFTLGVRALRSDNPTKALDYLQQAYKLRANNASIGQQTALWLADTYYSLHNFPEAEKFYRTFLQQAPKSDQNRPLATYNLAYAFFSQRAYADARKQFQAAKNLQIPAAAITDATNRIADTYYYSKEISKALDAYAEAYRLNPHSGDYPLLQQALMYGHLGNPTKKLAVLEQFITEFPSSSLRPDAVTEMALTQASLGKNKEAINTYRYITQAYPQTKQGRNALLQLAILSANSGKTQEAIGFYKQVITSYPSSSEASLAVQDLKTIYAARDEIEQLDSFLAAIPSAPQLDAVERNAIASASLLRKAQSATELTKRLEFASKLLELYPDSEQAEEALLIAANAQYELGLTERALDSFTRLEQRASSSTIRHNARMGILRAARDMGNEDIIISTSDRILAETSSSPSDLAEVKFIRASVLPQEQAIKLWRELAQDSGNVFGTRAAYEIADAQFRDNNLQAAEESVNALISANPPHAYWLARGYILLSDILRKKGDTFEADEYLRALRQNYPGTDADIFQMIDSRLK